jgi:putative pyruvate formate lyase activating enzyme
LKRETREVDDSRPGYLETKAGGVLDQRVEELYALLAPCRVCPRRCEVNRLEGETGYCDAPLEVFVSSAFPHFGEERPLVGRFGSGTVFLTGCSLRCVFCQNFHISVGREGTPQSIGALASAMVELQKRGCHNINLVTPTHYVPQIVKAVSAAADYGLVVPLVYNCGGYESLEVLRLLDGIIDVYMPDIKFLDPGLSKRFCNAPDYPSVAREAVLEMQRQVGDLVTDQDGVAIRGLLIRHLVMPSNLENTRDVLRFIRDEISEDAFVNIMAQYHPCYRAYDYPEIAHPITTEEYRLALQFARDMGLRRAGGH